MASAAQHPAHLTTASGLQPPARAEHQPAGHGHDQRQHTAQHHADHQVSLGVGGPDEAGPEAVNQVEEGVEMADRR